VPGLVADTTLRLISQHNDGTSRERGDVTPAFSPDGLWIAFARKTAEPTHWEIWKTPASGDTTQRVQLVFEDTGDDFYPQWSTDGQWIVYARISEGVESVWRVPAAGGTPEPVLSAGGGLMASTPAFSPDGAVILAGVGDPLAAVTHTLDARLTGLTLPSDFAVPSYPEYSVESGFPVLSPRSSPDGTRLALAAHQIYAARRNMSLPPRFDSVAGMGIAPATPFVVLEASEGSPLTFTVAASDPEGDPLDYRAFFLHDGMVFDPGTRTFSWTPPLGTLGTISSVRFQVATPSGGSAYAIARIAVTDLAAVGGPGAARVVALDPVRPNPVTAAATLRFALASAGRARVEVFDLNGRRVATALDESVSAGPHELSVATHAWRPGIYLCRLEAGGVTRVRRMAVVR
jgi:hypothetical protein